MPKTPKSPQEKKSLSYTRDHYTYGQQSSRNFPTTWRRKKAASNRVLRRKVDHLLAPIEAGLAAVEIEPLAEEVSIPRIEQLGRRKPLQKVGVVSVAKKVEQKLERRKQSVGRRSSQRKLAVERAEKAVATLTLLSGDLLNETIRRVGLVCLPEVDFAELLRLNRSEDPIDVAIHFVAESTRMSLARTHPLCMNPRLGADFSAWLKKANLLLNRERRLVLRKEEQKRKAKLKINGLSRSAKAK